MDGKNVISRWQTWHDFLMVNKSKAVGSTRPGNDGTINKYLKSLLYYYARSAGNPTKNIVIPEVGTDTNTVINIPVNISVDVHSRPLCHP
jgi:hypothetical protein